MAAHPKPVPATLIEGTLESSLYAKDLEAAEVFYGQTLGLPLIGKVAGRHVFFRVGASVLLVFNPDATRQPPGPDSRLPVPPHGAEGAGHYCFSVPGDQLDAMRDGLRGSGIAIEQEVQWPNGARSFYVRDPAGNSVEFAEPGLWA